MNTHLYLEQMPAAYVATFLAVFYATVFARIRKDVKIRIASGNVHWNAREEKYHLMNIAFVLCVFFGLQVTCTVDLLISECMWSFSWFSVILYMTIDMVCVLLMLYTDLLWDYLHLASALCKVVLNTLVINSSDECDDHTQIWVVCFIIVSFAHAVGMAIVEACFCLTVYITPS